MIFTVVWRNITGDPRMNDEAKGDLVDFVLAFACIAPFFSTSFKQWGRDNLLRAYSYFSKQAMRQHATNGEVAHIPCGAGSLMDKEDEEEHTAQEPATAFRALPKEPTDPFPEVPRQPAPREPATPDQVEKAPVAQRESDAFPDMQRK